MKEANDQINEEYKEGVTYKTLTDGDEVKFIGVVFDKGSNDPRKLILTSRTNKEGFIPLKVVHSSHTLLPHLRQCSKREPSSPENPPKRRRKERSVRMACIDSLDEEEITEEEKEQRIKELLSNEEITDVNFKKLEGEIRSETFSRNEKIRDGTTDSVNKSDLLSQALKSCKLSKSLELISQEVEVSAELQRKAYYNALIDLGALIYDHKNHVNGDRLKELEDRIWSSQLFSVAHDLYYLSKSEDNIDQDRLYSEQIKNKISLSVEDGNRLDDMYTGFSNFDLKGYFSDGNIKNLYTETEAYYGEVITINSPRVFARVTNTDNIEVYVEVKDNNGNNRKLVVGNVADMQDVKNYIIAESNLEIKLKVSNDKEYTITGEVAEGNIKHYLNIEGYKIKIDHVISHFPDNTQKGAIRDKLNELENTIELKNIESISQSDQTYYDDGVNEIKQGFLEKGIREDTVNRLIDNVVNLNEKVFAEYIENVGKNLEEQRIEFDRNKFDLAKVKGAKGGKFFSLMAIYDLFDSIGDTTTLGRHDNDVLKKIFGINGILDAMDDVRESLSTNYIRSDGRTVTRISRDGAIGKAISKIPDSVRKTFVKIINNPVVQGITFVTIAYQFGYSINEIIKGNHYPLNYYWTTSSGVKLASMSIKPISVGINSAMKGISATTKVLRRLSAVSKVLGKASKATIVADIFITIGVKIYERIEYTKTIAEQVPLLPGNEQAEVFFAGTIKFFTGRDVEKEYENSVILKGQLLFIKVTANDLLSKDQNIGTVVQYVNKIETKYDEIIKFTGSTVENIEMAIKEQICAFEKVYSPHFKLDHGLERNLSTLNVYQILSMTSHTLVLNRDLEQFACDFIENFSTDQGRSCKVSLNDNRAYFIDLSKKHLPHLSWKEYENDLLRVISMPQDYKEKTTCSGIINNEHYKTSHGLLGTSYNCNVNKVYRNCTQVFTLSDQPFIFTKLSRQTSQYSVAYLLGPSELIAAANYPAVMYVPGGNINYVGSKNYETIFVVNKSTFGNLTGGTEKENTIVMNAEHGRTLADLRNGMISRRIGHSGDLDIILHLANIHNYISNSHNSQEVHTSCSTRFINATSTQGNSIIQGDLHCKDQDYEIRVVNQKDIHYRGLKQAIFVISKDSNDAKIVDNMRFGTKKNIDIVSVQGTDIAELRVNESAEDDKYELSLLANNGSDIISNIGVDSFENMAIQITEQGMTKFIMIRDKSLSDTLEDVKYQQLGSPKENYIDGKVIQNSKRKSKAVIQASITDSKQPDTYQVAKGIADNSLGIPISQVEVTRNCTGVPTEKVIIGGMYSDRIVVDFNYDNSTNCYQDIAVEGREGQEQYIVKLLKHNDTLLEHKVILSPIELNLIPTLIINEPNKKHCRVV